MPSTVDSLYPVTRLSVCLSRLFAYLGSLIFVVTNHTIAPTAIYNKNAESQMTKLYPG